MHALVSYWQQRRGAARPRLGFRKLTAAIAVALGLIVPPQDAAARASYAASSGPVYEVLLLDVETGQVLRALNPDVPTQPASLTKMMTLYMTFEALNGGRLRLDQALPVSSEAAAHSPSKLGLQPGESVLVRDLVLGLVTRSANDAAAVLADALGGSEAGFAHRMTYKARQLGMSQTVFRNASGLPDPDQRTTARDMARLALSLYQHFPREYRYFAIQEFEFRGQTIHTHNHFLEWYEGSDGIKTGYVHASGFNLAASAVRNGRRLIGVIMGGSSARQRDREMGALLDQGFVDLSQMIASRGAAPLVAVAAPAAAAPAASVAAPVAAPPSISPASILAAVPVRPVPTVAAAPARPAPAVAAASSRPAAAAAQDPGGDAAERQDLSAVARKALRHLAPVSRAEAAPAARETPVGAEDALVQLGAFRSEHAAEQAVRSAGGLPLTRGKQTQVMSPTRGEKPALYRAQIYPFTAKAAQAACAALHKKGIECSVVRSRTHLASQTR